MERNHVIESICTVCHCAARRAEEYLDNELIRLRALYDAGELCYGDLETACSDLGLEYDCDLLQSFPYCDPKSGQPTTDTALVVPELHGLRVRRFGLDGLRTLHGARTRVSPKCIPGADVLAARRSDAIYPNHLLRPMDALSGRQCLQVRTMAPYYTLIRRPRKGAVFI